MKPIILSILVTAIAVPAHARRGEPLVPTSATPIRASRVEGPRAVASSDTTLLASFTFDNGGACDAQGWTAVDNTAQPGLFWHVDDFAGANVNSGDIYAPIAGNRSLWCGARQSTTGPTCGYLVLPGYGNSWNQLWQTKTCIPVTGMLDVSFVMSLDSESGYDTTTLEYTTDCVAPYHGWVELDGGLGLWDGIGTITVSDAYAVSSTSVKVALRFTSDGGWSDEDGLWDSHAGPVVIDNLTVEGLATETFESIAVGATSTTDWEASQPGPFGNHMALFHAGQLLQEDPCATNLSCVWASIAGSTETFACGGFPQQAAVPRHNAHAQYLDNAIISPAIPISGSGHAFAFQMSVYQDNPLDNLVFWQWKVRSKQADGCSGGWRSDNFVFYASSLNKSWIEFRRDLTGYVEPDAASMQLQVGVVDMCPYWCGALGTASCHSHAPLFDNIRVYRVESYGPTFTVRDVDMFQDTFPIDGTTTGIGRADAAISITPQASPTILPGDSARVICRDPLTATAANLSGLATDNLGAANGTKAIYIYVHVFDNGVPSAAKTGAALSGGPLYPFKDTIVADGKTWTRIQMWRRVNSTSTFVVDLNDNVFQGGDVVEFFFGATSTSGHTGYCSGSSLTVVQDDLAFAAQTASEFSILPINGGVSTNILYVDGMDGRGGQEMWDTAFEQLGIVPDRYDVRAPSSFLPNRPGKRVTNVAAQLNASYTTMLWDEGDVGINAAYYGAHNDKSTDFAMLNTFLAGLSAPGGLYMCGDDIPATTSENRTPEMQFKSTYIPFTLIASNHRATYGISPLCVGTMGGAFDGDSWVAGGGCPLLNDFDVMQPTGASVMQSSYGAASTNNAAEISKTTGNATVLLGGFSLIYLRDDDTDGLSDRVQHLDRVLTLLNGAHDPPTDVPSIVANRLEQNYPNPFNPQTTIAFSIRETSRVRIDVFNVSGALVRTLVDEARPAGAYTDVRWDATDRHGQPVASGVYWYRLTAGTYSEARKMVLLK